MPWPKSSPNTNRWTKRNRDVAGIAWFDSARKAALEAGATGRDFEAQGLSQDFSYAVFVCYNANAGNQHRSQP